MDITELGQELNRRGATDAQLGALLRTGRLDDAASGPFMDDTRFEDLLDDAEELVARASSPSLARVATEPVSSTWSDPRYWALSRAVATIGSTWPEVAEFRKSALGHRDAVLTPAEAAAWVSSHVESDRTQHHESRFRHLEWGVPGVHRHLFVVPAWPGTILDGLRRTADAVRRRVPPWRQAEAAVFVLTGETVPIPAMRGWIETADMELDGMRRVILQVSPAVPVQRVAALYAKMRDQALAGAPAPRRLDEKTAELAVFTLSRRTWAEGRTGSASWADGMRQWNRLYPEWEYRHSGHFSRDCSAACARVGIYTED